MFKQMIIAILLALGISTAKVERDSLRGSLALDISPFLLGGYSLKGGLTGLPIYFSELSLEVFSMEIPSSMVEMSSKNRDKNWKERVELGMALYFDRPWGNEKEGFWWGGGLVYLSQSLEQNGVTYDFAQFEGLGRLSYKWYPGDQESLYLQPYTALAFRQKVSGDVKDYDLFPVILIPSVYMSFEF